MKKYVQRLLSIVLCIFIVLSCFTVSAFAASIEDCTFIKGTYEPGTYGYGYIILLFCSKSASGELYVPSSRSSFEGDGIGKIAPCAFSGCTQLEKIKIEATNDIGEFAFENCVSLKELVLPGSLYRLGEGFVDGCTSLERIICGGRNSRYYCSDDYGVLYKNNFKELIRFPQANPEESYTMPDTVETIHDDAFKDCKNLKNLEIHGEVKTIPSGAFSGACSLETIALPASITTIEQLNFTKMPNLRTVYFKGTESEWNQIDIESGNEDLINANIIFTGTESHDPALKLNENSKSVFIGESFHLDVKNEYDKTVTNGLIWSSTNESVATVTDGTIVAKGVGVATITVKSEKYSDVTDFCTVRVASLTPSNDYTTFDYCKGLVYGFTVNTSSIEQFVDVVDKSTSIEVSTSSIGTGSEINVVRDGEIIDTYKAVVFGDLTGDSWYDGQDAIIVNCIANGLLTKEDVGEAVYMAADCNHDGVIDNLDVDILQQAGVLLANVDQSKTPAELFEDVAFCKYISLIDQNPTTETPAEETPANVTPIDESVDDGFNQSFIQRIIDFIIFIVNLMKTFIAKI